MNPVLKAALSWVASHLLVVAGAAGLIYGILVKEHTDRLSAERDKASAALVAAEAAKRGAVEGQLVNERAMRASLSAQQQEFLAELQKIEKRVAASEQSKTTIAVEDKPAGHVTAPPAGGPGQSFWSDDFHRFRWVWPSGPFFRKQKFGLDALIVAGVAGQRLEKVTFHEYDPETGAEIPLTGVDIKTDFKFTREDAPAASPWHARFVAAVDHRGAPGGGIAFNPWRGLVLAGLGLYSPKDGDGRGAVGLGWRLRFPGFDSTVAPLGYVGFSTKGGGVVFGAAASIELTR